MHLEQEVQVQIDSFKEQFKNYNIYIKKNDWREEYEQEIYYKTEADLCTSIVSNLDKFIKENAEVKDNKDVQKFLKESLKITDVHIKRINDYLEANDWTVDFEERKEKLLEKINLVEFSEDELDKRELKDLKKELEQLEKDKRSQIEFQRTLFDQKTKVRVNILKLDVEGKKEAVNKYDSMFFDKKRAPLLMRNFLSSRISDVNKETSLLNVNWESPMPQNSSEMFINMKEKDIPEYDSNKHFWEQAESTIQFWEEEIRKIKNGVNVGGYHISPFLYWHINFFKIGLGEGQDKSVRNVDFRDNEFMFDYMNNKAIEDGRKALLLYGSRRWSKSVIMSSFITHGMYTIENCKGSIQGFSGSDLEQLRGYMSESVTSLNEALKVNVLRNNDKSFELGLKRTQQDEYEFAKLAILNLEAGSKMGSQKTAGGTPDISVFDEIGKGDILKAWGAALPSFEGGKNGKWRCRAILSGTAGEGELSKDAEEMLQQPEAFNILLMDWDKLEERVSIEDITWKRRTFGMFLPAQMNLTTPKINTKFGDYLGGEFKDNKSLNKITIKETDWKRAKEHFESERHSRRRNLKSLGEEIRFHPLDPEDVFLSSEKNPFNALRLKAHKVELYENDLVGVNYDLSMEYGEVSKIHSNKKPIIDYPYKGGNHDAPVVIIQPPEENPPLYLYVLGFDDAKQETSNGDSVRSATVYRRGYELNEMSDSIVAYYDSRQERPEDYYKTLYMLMIMYNAQVFHENADNGYQDFLERKYPIDAVRYLVPAVDFAVTVGFQNNNNRRYGYHPSAQNNRHLLQRVLAYTSDDYKEGIGNGHERIRHPMLLEEMIQYKKENNADRLRSFGLALIYAEFLDKQHMYPRKMKKMEYDNPEVQRQKKKTIKGFTNTSKFQKSNWKRRG